MQPLTWFSAATTTGDGVLPSQRAPLSLALLSPSQAPQPRAELGVVPAPPPDPGVLLLPLCTPGPLPVLRGPPSKCRTPTFPQAPQASFLLSPFPRSPPYWPSSGSPAGPMSPANMFQAQGCHPPELGVQGDSRGCWAPGRHPPRGQPRTSIPGLLCIVPGPGPTGSPADPTLFLGLLGALWVVGQLRETGCPELVSQAGVRRVVGVCREASSKSSCPTIPGPSP